MKPDDSIYIEIAHLTLLSKEGVISKEQFARLESLLQTNPFARQSYLTLVNNELCLHDADLVTCFSERSLFEIDELLHELAEYEKIAPTIEIHREAPKRELIQKVVYPKSKKRQLTKFQIFSLITSAAAILFLIAFPRIFPLRPYSVEVATLVDQMGVCWSDSYSAIENGSRLSTNAGPLELKKGIVKIRYDNGVDVLIEGPAAFELERSGVYVEYGRLFSHVTDSGLGFSVETPTCKFVDLGTEFGIQADVNGSSELHVIKGRVHLFTESKKRTRMSRTIQENTAVRYDTNTGQALPVPVQTQAFVRHVDSEANVIWRGQKVIDLADIVAGGNGFGTGTSGVAIHPREGRIYRPTKAFTRFTRDPEKPVAAVPEIASVDCVFIPGKQADAIPVSTDGQVWNSCPDTNGTCIWGPGGNFKFIAGNGTRLPLLLNSDEYGTPQKPAISMHSNAGITFDLGVLRNQTPTLEIGRFKSCFGMSESVTLGRVMGREVDVWVLLDGQVAYQKRGVKIGDIAPIDIEISGQTRFLSLVVTEGTDEIGGDWAAFGQPVLELMSN